MSRRRRMALPAVVLLTVTLPFLTLADLARAADAKQAYEVHCASCHGPGGKGDGPAGQFLTPKPLDFATVLADQSDETITKVIADGGGGVGKSPVMPAYKGKLTDEDIEALVQYVKHLAAQ